MWRLLLGTMGVKSLVQGLNAAATAGFQPRTVWSKVRRCNRLATAPPFWWFVFLWVNFVLLKPIESFSWRGCVVQATKNKEESCSFLDAIGLCSCGPLSGLVKTDLWENPSFDSSGSRQLVGMLRCALLLFSDLHFNSRLARLSSACISLGMLLKAKFTPAVSSVRSLTPSPPLSLSLSPFDQMRAKESLLLSTTVRTSKRKFSKCGHQVQVSRAHTASMQWLIQKKKCRAFSCNVKLCFVNFERPQTRSRLGQLHAEWCNFCSLRVTFWM